MKIVNNSKGELRRTSTNDQKTGRRPENATILEKFHYQSEKAGM